MKSKTLLHSAVFQLTPTRTRFDLVIFANGVSEKIASGLLNSFVAHLKTAQDQIAKGGYSLTLEPSPGSDATWFTKATMNRFVRFVNTPEVLERVNTIESEILEIEESITIQRNENLGLSTQVDVHQNNVGDHQMETRYLESNEGTKLVNDSDVEKAIVLYKPEAHSPGSNGSTRQEENSKVQLLKVLETRKAVLQKEQGMAFARAVAAGFEMDHIVHLISFGECFGATRLRDACVRFVQLWKEKHETGQWLEIDLAESISNRSDIREVWPESTNQLSNNSSGKASDDTTAEKKSPLHAQVPPGNPEYFQGQYQHPMYPQWPFQSPTGAPPVFQPYPMHGMPYYQNYPGNAPFFQSPYPPMEDPRFSSSQRVGLRRQSLDSKGSNTESESGELGVSNMRSQDDSELDNEGSHQQSGRKAGRSSKNQAGMVVIRNINYITSKKRNTSESESESSSDPETENYSEDLQSVQEMNRKNSKKNPSSTNTYNSHGNDEGLYEQDTDGENWQAFQKMLLRNEDIDAHHTDHNMFSLEKDAQVARQINTMGPDPTISRGQDRSEVHDGRIIEFDSNYKATSMLKASTEELVSRGKDFGGEYSERQVNVHLTEMGGRGGYRTVGTDDFMIHRRENRLGYVDSESGPLSGTQLEHASDNWDKRLPLNVIDESFVVPVRSGLHDQLRSDSRTALDINVEFPSGMQNTDDPSNRVKNQISYEPEDLSLIPEHGTEKESIGYDPSMDYEMQVQADEAVRVPNRDEDDAVNDIKEKEKTLLKNKKNKGQDSVEKRKIEAATRKGKPSTSSPSTEAQARAAKLRAFKADLQKIKKEQEEEEVKRLEALKRERQKRIAGRGNSGSAQTQLPTQMKPRLPTKLSPNSHRGSKFSDSQPGSSSPIQRLPFRTASLGPNESAKVIKSSRLNNNGHLGLNILSRSVSSLPDLKKERDVTTPELKVSTARLRRLSEPKTRTINHAASVKLRSTDPVSKSKVSNGPEIKKISAIMSLDRTKAETLPELKIRTPKESSDLIENKSVSKEVAQKANGTESSVISGSSKSKINNENTSLDRTADDNHVIEKAIVTLECETPPVPSMQRSEEKTETRNTSYEEDKAGAKHELVTQYAAIYAPVSSVPMTEVTQNPSERQFSNHPSMHKVKADRGGIELPYISSVGEKLYQAPYARASSMEERGTTKLEHADAPKEHVGGAVSSNTANSQASDFEDLSSLEENLESSGRPQGKEPSKGFKRLLKFGRKNIGSSGGERPVESDKLTTNGSTGDDHSASSAPHEVPTLKNLLSHDESPTTSTSHKVSRHFSLLSPFRSKTSEKKLAT